MEEAKKKMGRPATRNPVRLGVSITEKVKERLEEMARKEHRSINYVVCSLLDQALGIEEASDAPAPLAKRLRTGGRVSEGATAMLTISLQPELKAAVQDVARSENRTTSNMACLMLRDWIMDYEYRNSKKESGDD